MQRKRPVRPENELLNEKFIWPIRFANSKQMFAYPWKEKRRGRVVSDCKRLNLYFIPITTYANRYHLYMYIVGLEGFDEIKRVLT